MFWKRWEFLAVCTVILSFLGLLTFGFKTDPKKVPSPWIGKPAPDFEVTRLQGTEGLRLNDLKGRPVILNFWASWCQECQAEAGVLEAFYQQAEVKEGQVKVIGIAIQDTPEKAQAFAQHFGKNYFLALDDPKGKIALDYGIYGVPETFFIDAQGVIRFKQIGGVTPELLQQQLQALLQVPKNG